MRIIWSITALAVVASTGAIVAIQLTPITDPVAWVLIGVGAAFVTVLAGSGWFSAD